MTAFDTTWALLKEAKLDMNPPASKDSGSQRCDHTTRIITTNGSYMARCIREKDHPKTGKGLSNLQVLMGGHIYPNRPEDGLMFSNEDVIPRSPLVSNILQELEGYE